MGIITLPRLTLRPFRRTDGQELWQLLNQEAVDVYKRQSPAPAPLRRILSPPRKNCPMACCKTSSMTTGPGKAMTMWFPISGFMPMCALLPGWG